MNNRQIFSNLWRSAWLSLLMILAPAAFAQTAVIEGTVTDSSGAVSGATVIVADPVATSSVLAHATTDSLGQYSITVPGFKIGQTRDLIVEAASPDHAPARHGFSDSLPCFFNCLPGGEIPVTEGTTVTGINMVLSPGARFSGRVTNAATGAPIAGARINLISEELFGYTEDFVAVSDAAGDYQMPLAVSATQHFALASSAGNFVTSAYNGRSCEFSRCGVASVDPLPLISGTVSAGIDFALQPGAMLSGELLPDSVPRLIVLFNAAGVQLATRFIGPAELPATSWSFDGLAGGSYYVQLGPPSGSSDYLRVLHNGLLCPFSGCERAQGSPLTVPPRGSATLPPIALSTGGRIDGEIVDASTGLAPTGVPGGAQLGFYDIINAAGEVVGGGQIRESAGSIRLLPSAALPAGSYFVRTYGAFFADSLGYPSLAPRSWTLDGYMDAIHPNQPCAGSGCDLSAATPVTVTVGNTTSITIEVDQGSYIEGRIIDNSTGLPIARTPVKLVNAANEQLAAVMADNNGTFRFGAFPAGSYYLRTSMGGSIGPGVGPVQNAYFDQVYGAPDSCSEALCDPTLGTPIVLDGSSDVNLGDIAADPGPVISGQIVDVTSGAIIPRGQVEVFTAGGDFVGSFMINFLNGRYQTPALPPGTYTLVPVVSPAYGSVATAGGTSPTARSAAPPDSGFHVSLGSDSVDVDLQVVDRGIDRVFQDGFRAAEE
ncbi:MAG: carboxypeptidase-like regulatory domain-containing protein [Wenzhouxiangella sp.]|jgi:hypothetical protein|nr:carboxypeptidase-like regulatory domain-containing protein [Wenzhouxiangella sp.]